MRTLNELRTSDAILFEAVSGSKAYGLDTPESDTDIRGVFIAPREMVYAGDAPPQISDKKNDTVYYEIGRFLELLSQANPTALELLYSPRPAIRIQHPVFDLIPKQAFLTRQCRSTFAGYAHAQIKKARGLNKKISSPMPEERKQVIDFCYVADRQGATPITAWLLDRNLAAAQCGLIHIPHMPHLHALFYDESGKHGFRGITLTEQSDGVVLSSIPKGQAPIAYMSFNKDGYSRHCREHTEYWSWVKQRNKQRYAQNVANGRNYDAKNMMHTFRLLDMAIEIATEQTIHVRRDNPSELIQIRNGTFNYGELLERAEVQLNEIEQAFDAAPLQDQADPKFTRQLVVDIRTRIYGQ